MIPNFPAKLTAILTEKNISQRKFAIAVGVTPQTANAWIKGECYPSLETYRIICEVLHISADYLLSLN